MFYDLPPALHQRCQQILGTTIHKVEFVGGGDINQARLLKAAKGHFFIKINKADFALEMFEKEAKGLALLKKSQAIRTPEVIAFDQTENESFLLLEYLEKGYRSEGFWEEFGQSLAALHRTTSNQFGLDHSNYIGSLSQPNGHHDTFIDFYINERLQPQLDLARNSKELTVRDEKHFKNLYKKLPELLPDEPPALIHGDLWSGNFLVGAEGGPVLIDPSVAFSHRELDLGMSRLFGGFDRTFYRAYEAAYPLAPGFEKRLPIWQLYYLLVHVNLFGGGYVGSVRRIVEKF
ncbi:MAG: fructosamine kinase family protein [Bacteroidota bacterium]